MEYDLVMEGGGARAWAILGALQEFEARGHTTQRIMGISGGALVAVLLAAGYSAQEMLAAMAEKEAGHSVFARFLNVPGPFRRADMEHSTTFASFFNLDLPFFSDSLKEKLNKTLAASAMQNPGFNQYFAFLEYGGLYSSEFFLTWLQIRLNSGMHLGKPRSYGSMTLSQFHDATGQSLSLVTSDATTGEMLVLNHNTAPDLPVVWAARMSMSIPLVWQEVIWAPEWGRYLGRDMAGHSTFDGSLLSNFPLELFISSDSTVRSIMGQDTGEAVLGLLVDDSLLVEGVRGGAGPVTGLGLSVAPVVQRTARLLNVTMGARDHMINDAYEALVARLPGQGYSATEFDMPDERRNLLIGAGQAATRAYFDRPREWGFDTSFDLDRPAEAPSKPAAPSPAGFSFDLYGIGDEVLSAEEVAERNRLVVEVSGKYFENEQKGSPFIT